MLSGLTERPGLRHTVQELRDAHERAVATNQPGPVLVGAVLHLAGQLDSRRASRALRNVVLEDG
jgi:hypothetical protein